MIKKVLLSDLVQGLPILVQTDIAVTDVVFRLSHCKPGVLFCALGKRWVPEMTESETDSHLAEEAFRRGALAVIGDGDPAGVSGPFFQVAREQLAEITAIIARRFYGDPCAGLKMIGITGTNGKTSITRMLLSIWEYADRVAAGIGTLGVESSVFRLAPEGFTTPPSPRFFQLAAAIAEAGADTLVLEATSHGLSLFREHGSEYDTAVFTNFTPDHLDVHGDLENYRQAKLGLFRRLPRQKQKRHANAVLNADDPSFSYFREACGSSPVWTYSLESSRADFFVDQIEKTADGQRARLTYPAGRVLLSLPLWGRFNLANALAAFACAYVNGIPVERILLGLSNLQPVPGRFEMVPDVPVPTVIDFAHTPDSLEKIILAARELCRGRLWVVFGCGGNRDRSKRPIMGGIASRLADIAIVTSDNPRMEPPDKIVDEVLAGVADGDRHKVRRCVDRREAIYEALSAAKPEDLVLIAGKGHEAIQIIGDQALPFRDHDVVRDFFAKVNVKG